MFLSFGRKGSTTKKSETPAEPRYVSQATTPGAISGVSGSSRCSKATVQTTAGPLLSSSRFNTILDASTIANVSSPGFTSRVVNCASSGNSSHQSKYSSVGLFPHVQLKRPSILPTLSPRNSQKVGRTPVRIRIAPPAFSQHRRHSFSGGPTEKTKTAISDIIKRSPASSVQYPGSDTIISTESVDNITALQENPQEPSRKRIFSDCQDNCNEAKKRRRKTEIAIPNPNDDIYQYRYVQAPSPPSSPPNRDISTQVKRAREKGSPEEQKRQKRKICNTNNAIFSSLSSSRNLLEKIAAQKRKSADVSRSSSPLTPLSSKQVKENRTSSKAKAVQCNLDTVAQCASTESNHFNNANASNKTIVKRSGDSLKEISASGSFCETNVTPTCDYTTKLFRKEVSSLSKPSISKERKPSMWIQPPEADELTCSLLIDDSKLDRPDRLRNLLACVSGKADKTQTVLASEGKTIGNPLSKPAGSLVSNGNTSKLHSSPGANLSSALTVTVSSTSTIMTSATVTSVNGVPSSESSPPGSPACRVSAGSGTSTFLLSSQASKSMASVLNSSPKLIVSSQTLSSPTAATASCAPSNREEPVASIPTTTTSSAPVISACMAGVSQSNALLGTSMTSASSLLSPGALTSASGSFSFGSDSKVSPSGGTSSPIAPTFALNTGQGVVKSPVVQSSNGSMPTIFGLKAQADSNQPFQMGTGAVNPGALSDSSLKFGSVGSNTTMPSSVLSSSCGNPTPKPVFQFPAASNAATSSNSILSSSKPMFQMITPSEPLKAVLPNDAPGSTIKPSFSFGSNGSNTNVDSTKSTFQFGLTKPASSEVPSVSDHTQAFQPTVLGTSSNASNPVADKPSFSFGSSSNASSTLKPSFSFGSNNSGSAESLKSTASFGLNTSNVTGTPKQSFQFGPSSSNSTESTKQAFQFASGVSQASNSTPAFGSLNGVAGTGKQSFQFGSSSSNPSEPSKTSFQFSSSTNSKPDAFSKPTFGSTGSSLQSSSSSFGQAAQSQTKGNFTFQSSVQSGSNAGSHGESKGNFLFGSSSSAISSSPFGSGSSIASAFGGPATSVQPTLPSFGSLTEVKQTTSPFGSSSTKSNGSSGPTSTFQFGGQNSGGPFSSGQKQDQTPSAFSFNATITAVPNQVAQAPGLFSIGAGSSTTQRRIREVRRRR